jgi:hypothetical protein
LPASLVGAAGSTGERVTSVVAAVWPRHAACRCAGADAEGFASTAAAKYEPWTCDVAAGGGAQQLVSKFFRSKRFVAEDGWFGHGRAKYASWWPGDL